MNNQPGTLELIASEIAKIFAPLEETINSGQVLQLFAELGIQFPESLATDTNFSNALSGLATLAGTLPQLIVDLSQAVSTEDYSTIVQKLVELSSKFKSLIDNFETVADTIAAQRNSLPGLTPSEVEDFASSLPARLADYLLIHYVEDNMPPLAVMLDFIGIFERTEKNVGSTNPLKPSYIERKLNGGNITAFLQSPSDQLETLYGWGSNSFDGKVLLPKLEKLALELGLPALYTEVGTPTLDVMFLEVQPKTDVDPRGIILLLTAVLKAGQTFTLKRDQWELEFGAEIAAPLGSSLIIQPNANLVFEPPSGEISGEVFIRWVTKPDTADEFFLLVGEANESRLEFRELSAEVRIRLNWNASSGSANGELLFESELKEGQLIIDLASADSFISETVSSGGFSAQFGLVMGISTREGFYFRGSSALEVQIPVHIDLSIIEIQSITLIAGVQSGTFPVSLGADIKANLGPLKAVVENIGFSADFSFPGQRGNLGPLDLSFGFKPPNGVGLSLDAGVVKGGGYLYIDVEREEYAGALELVFSEFLTLKAIGLITTRLPDGSKGFSLLIIITAEFGSGFQLGFGFVLLGIGGLLGLNRTMRLQPLTDGVRTGATESILFPQDVIANAPRIISDLRRFFPPEEGIFLIGPMAKLGWGTPALITLSLGIIFEIPGNIAILGVLKVVLPDEKAPLLVLQVAFIGAIEFDKQRAYFFAAIFESRVLFITIEGEMGVLVAWGNDSNFVVSVGGFHPHFTPPPLPFPTPKRVSFNILNESWGRIRVMGYFAVTSNTVQLGARAELYFRFGSIKIEGHLAFDALFQFNPFFFIIEISCGVSLKVFGIGLFSISLQFSLEGPTPWRAKGYGRIKLLFFTIKAKFDFTWGEKKDTSLSPIEVLPLLKEEFEKLSNWQAQLPASSSLLVSLRMLEEGSDSLVLHPVGTLTVTQRAVPLDIQLDKVGNQKPKDGKRFYLDVTSGLKKVGDLEEQFAIAQFQDFKDADKLSQAAFQPEEAGLELAVSDRSFATGKAVKRNIRYETHIIDTNFLFAIIALFNFVSRLFNHFLNGSVVTKSVLSQHYKRQFQPFDDKITLRPEQFVVASTIDNNAMSQQAIFTSEAKAQEFMQAEIAKDPKLRDFLHVISSDEVNTYV